MTTERAKRLAKQWANGYVCSLREGEAEEYHKLCFSALRAQQEKPFGDWISVEDRLPSLVKHLVALRDKIERNDFSDRYDLLEKCKDSINYICFLWCIGNEEERR